MNHRLDATLQMIVDELAMTFEIIERTTKKAGKMWNVKLEILSQDPFRQIGYGAPWTSLSLVRGSQ